MPALCNRRYIVSIAGDPARVLRDRCAAAAGHGSAAVDDRLATGALTVRRVAAYMHVDN
jgi:hypothetical protein